MDPLPVEIGMKTSARTERLWARRSSKSVAELFDAALDPPARSQGLRAYRAVVPGGVGYQHDYQVAGDDYPGMRMQPNDRIRSVIIIFEMKPMSFALGRKHPGSSCIGR